MFDYDRRVFSYVSNTEDVHRLLLEIESMLNKHYDICDGLLHCVMILIIYVMFQYKSQHMLNMLV